MWLYGLLYIFVLPIVLTLLVILLTVALPVPEGAAAVIGWLVYLSVPFVLCPMYANALYYRHLTGKIESARQQSTRQQQLAGKALSLTPYLVDGEPPGFRSCGDAARRRCRTRRRTR